MSQPQQFLILTAVAWLNRQQDDVIDYLREENRILRERNHQGLDNKILDPEFSLTGGAGEVQCRERLGGLLRYYHREAA